MTLPSEIDWLKANSDMRGLPSHRQDKSGERCFRFSKKLAPINSIYPTCSSGHVPLETALNLLLYIEREEDYYPWFTMYEKTSSIIKNFSSNSYYREFTDVIDKVMMPYLNKLGWDDSGDSKTREIRILLTSLAAEMGFKEQIGWMMTAYWKIFGSSKKAHPLLEKHVYKYAVRYGGQEVWNHVMSIFTSTNASTSESELFLKALTYSTNHSNINRLLERSLNDDFMQVTQFLVLLKLIGEEPSTNKLGWLFVKTKWKEIVKK
ncbi:hypothetical protein HELRODRAFT_177627 [Helobdella robusta]|uniref:ERAP1-like C-terminal domain-containing protein n=1 Tax=Helobdella robusta TaxID=6412 RepID=T1FBY5_HELRO|nr:hypothetical protein HELRODRAFT_177627 [Helobdella robusta]ESN97956.1 hypothetical protein HELRODRAFT_177627 [Helobdella robusta]